MTTTVPLSRLVQRPTEVAALAAEDDVVLGRRDAEDLYLSTRERHEQEVQGLRITVGATAALARVRPELATESMAEAIPWMAWLPQEERLACLDELLADLRAGADTDHPRPFVLDLAAWRSTAIAWSDPEATRALLTDRGDDVDPMTAEQSLVPRPPG